MNQPSFEPPVRSVPHTATSRYRAGRLPRLAVGALAGVAAMLVAGCGNDNEYQTAVQTNTVSAYDDYLRLHPDGSHAAEARSHLAALVEDREWQRAHAAGSSDAYQQYLRGYPSGAHAHDALVAIADLNLAAVPSTEAPTTSPAPAPAPAAVAKPPSAPPAVKGPIARAAAPAVAAAPAKALAARATQPAPTAAAGVRIQLGAFGAKSGADAAWHRLTARYPELASRTPLIAAAKSADGRDIQRLQVGGFSRESASAMCAALAAKHDACLVVPATGAQAN